MIAKYIVVDDNAIDFELRNEDDLTFATATFPLRGRLVQPVDSESSAVEDA